MKKIIIILLIMGISIQASGETITVKGTDLTPFSGRIEFLDDGSILFLNLSYAKYLLTLDQVSKIHLTLTVKQDAFPGDPAFLEMRHFQSSKDSIRTAIDTCFIYYEEYYQQFFSFDSVASGEWIFGFINPKYSEDFDRNLYIQSMIFEINPLDTIPPDHPDPPEGPQSNGKILLTWDPNTEPDLAGYRVYAGTISGMYLYNINVGKITNYQWDNLPCGFTWYFVVTAYDDNNNESDFSNEVSVFFPCQGDYNNDGICDFSDFEIFTMNCFIPNPAPGIDLTGDGKVDFADFQKLTLLITF